MNNKEVRIGNLLRDKITKTELKVIGLTENNMITYVIDRSKFPLQDGWSIEPIPITAEWLVKLGFKHKKTDKANCYTLNFFSLNFVNDGRYKGKTFIRVANFNPDINNFLFVHQLQNLYFALTGQELTPSNHEPQS